MGSVITEGKFTQHGLWGHVRRASCCFGTVVWTGSSLGGKQSLEQNLRGGGGTMMGTKSNQGTGRILQPGGRAPATAWRLQVQEPVSMVHTQMRLKCVKSGCAGLQPSSVPQPTWGETQTPDTGPCTSPAGFDHGLGHPSFQNQSAQSSVDQEFRSGPGWWNRLHDAWGLSWEGTNG